MTSRMTAEDRREAVVAAAAQAFATAGYEATSTAEIARLAGISQPYVFRLFGTKRELFVAAVRRCFGRTLATFDAASQGLTGDEALAAMGAAYTELITDPSVLRLQMHAYAASVEDPEIRAATRDGLAQVWALAQSRSGADADTLRDFLATGMLCNVIAAVGLDHLAAPWAEGLMASVAAGPAKTRIRS